MSNWVKHLEEAKLLMQNHDYKRGAEALLRAHAETESLPSETPDWHGRFFIAQAAVFRAAAIGIDSAPLEQVKEFEEILRWALKFAHVFGKAASQFEPCKAALIQVLGLIEAYQRRTKGDRKRKPRQKRRSNHEH